MSQFSRNYSEYLGARRCCDLRGLGPQGNEGSTGPQGFQGITGPQGSGGGSYINIEKFNTVVATNIDNGSVTITLIN